MLITFLAVSPALGLTLDTGAMTVELAGDELLRLDATESGTSWLSIGSDTLYDLDSADLVPTVSAEALPDGQLLLTLELTNPTAADIRTDVTFPRVRNLSAGTSSGIEYVFPAQGAIFDDQVASHERYYSTLFPLQFMEIHEGSAGGVWLLSRDTTGRRKTFQLVKRSDDTGRLMVEWPDLVVPAGGSVTLEASLGVHDSDWHEAFDAYRRWQQSWYHPQQARSDTFREAFNLRQIHLHENSVLGSHEGAFDPDAGTYRIADFLAEDSAELGGVDWVHIFDWGMDWRHGRVGDYVPYSYLGDRDLLVAEVDALQAEGIGVGLYVEGYLLDTPSLVGNRWGDDWQLLNSSGSVYTHYAPSWHVCPAVPEWRDHFSLRNARRTELRVGASGLYVDQVGYGYQYLCYNPDHDHSQPSGQIAEELELLLASRQAMSPGQVLYSEAVPVDVVSQVSDGAFSEAVTSFRSDTRTRPVNIARFGLPDFKTFQLLTQDAALDDDVQGVMLAFFNGEGTRLMGYHDSDDWFTDEVAEVIRTSWGVLRAYRDNFTSSRPVPLVDTEQDGLYANYFPSEDVRLWTLYNSTDSIMLGTVLSVDAVPGDSWTDCWSGDSLSPSEVDGMAQVQVRVAPLEVGCVAQTLPTSTPTLVAHWELDETSGTALADSVGSATGVADGVTLGEPSSSAERFGTAAWFDGVDDTISLGEVPALAELTEDFSLSAWIHPDTVDGVQRILAVEGWSSGGFVFALTETGGMGAVALTTVGVKDYVLPVVIPPGQWTHLAVVVDAGSTATFYVDGHERGHVSHSTAASEAAAGYWIGSNHSTSGWFEGGIDDLRVYAGRLSPDQVRALADIEPPLEGRVRVADVDGVVRDASRVELWWPGFHDGGSGVSAYTVSLGTSEGGSDLYGPTDVGTALSGVIEGLTLPDGTVWATVDATDGVGLTTTVSEPFEVDLSEPALVEQWFFDSALGDGAEPVEYRPDRAWTERFSVTAWVEPAEAGVMQLLASVDTGWGLGLSGTSPWFVTWGLQDYVAEAEVPVGEWSHVAVVFDVFSDATFYVDGELVGTVYGAIPPLATDASLWVGGADNPWLGALDDVRLYDGELTAAQVERIYLGDMDTGDTGEPGDKGDTGDTGPAPDTADTGEPDEGDETGNARRPSDTGCGCVASSSRPGPGALGFLGLLGLAVRRRRDPRRHCENFPSAGLRSVWRNPDNRPQNVRKCERIPAGCSWHRSCFTGRHRHPRTRKTP